MPIIQAKKQTNKQTNKQRKNDKRKKTLFCTGPARCSEKSLMKLSAVSSKP